MNQIFSTILMVCALFFFSPLNAQALKTFNDYVQTALQKNEKIQSSLQKWQALTFQEKQAESLPDPRFAYQYFIENIETKTGPQENAFSISQAFPSMGKRRLQVDIATARAASARHIYEDQKFDIIRELAKGFYDYAYLGKWKEIEQKNKKLLAFLTPVVQEKVRGGDALKISLRLELEIGKSEDVLQSLDHEQIMQSSALRALLGEDVLLENNLLLFPFLSDFTPLEETLPELKKKLLNKNPELLGHTALMLGAEYSYKLSKLNRFPNPALSVNAIEIGDGGDTAISAGIAFSIPLWSGKYTAEKKEAMKNWEAEKSSFGNTQKQLLSKLERTWNIWSENRKRISHYEKKLIPIAKQAIEIAQNDYQVDHTTIFELIDTQRVLLDLEKRYWRAVANTHQYRIEIRTLIGELP